MSHALNPRGPSPVLHAGLSLAALLGLVGACFGLVTALGDPSRAGPVKLLAVHDEDKPVTRTGPRDLAALGLRNRLDAEGPDAADPAADAVAEALLGAPAPTGNIPVYNVTVPKTLARGAPLSRAPISAVQRPGPEGSLPFPATDGRTPFGVYKRPFDASEPKPKIAIILGGLGLNSQLTRSAINDLPPEITLSFVPYAKGLQGWIDQARAAGHEVLLELPLEPFDYPDNDTGPYTLLADNDLAENTKRLEWILARAAGYWGVINYQGAKFSGSANAILSMQKELTRHGVAFVHDGGPQRAAYESVAAQAKTTFGAADRILDERPSRESIDQRLLELEALALQRGSATGTAFAYPVTISQLRSWAQSLTLKGYALAPSSALVVRAPAK